MWSKAQTTGEIINRSGTVLSSANNKDYAMRDAEKDCQQVVGFLEMMGLDFFGNENKKNSSGGFASVGMPINPYLWSASLETLSFMPLKFCRSFWWDYFY